MFISERDWICGNNRLILRDTRGYIYRGEEILGQKETRNKISSGLQPYHISTTTIRGRPANKPGPGPHPTVWPVNSLAHDQYKHDYISYLTIR